jgi:hypothetical protein
MVCLSGIMFDSPFLSDGSYPLRGIILAYISIAVIVFSLIFFIGAFLWEIRTSRTKKKTKRQVMWSKLRGMKHIVLEDSRRQAKKSKLQMLMAKSAPKKVQPFDLKKLTTIVPAASAKALKKKVPPILANGVNQPGVDGQKMSSSSGESLMDFVSSSSAADSSNDPGSSNLTTSSSDKGSSGTISSSSDSIIHTSGSDSQISYEKESSESSSDSVETFDDESAHESGDGLSSNSASEGSGGALNSDTGEEIPGFSGEESNPKDDEELLLVDSD